MILYAKIAPQRNIDYTGHIEAELRYALKLALNFPGNKDRLADTARIDALVVGDQVIVATQYDNPLVYIAQNSRDPHAAIIAKLTLEYEGRVAYDEDWIHDQITQFIDVNKNPRWQKTIALSLVDLAAKYSCVTDAHDNYPFTKPRYAIQAEWPFIDLYDEMKIDDKTPAYYALLSIENM